MKPDLEYAKALLLELEDCADWVHRIGPETPKKLAHAKLMVDNGHLEHEGNWMFRITSKGHGICDAIRKERRGNNAATPSSNSPVHAASRGGLG